MAITRRTNFGMLPAPRGSSAMTSRQVPLTTGVNLSAPWPALPPGSSVSMTNFLPLDGGIRPRSRYSSLNTLGTMSGIKGMGLLTNIDVNGNDLIWVSGSTARHALVTSTGSISLASFVSAGGIGSFNTGLLADAWQYATYYSSTLDQNMLIAALQGGSRLTLMALYQAGGSDTGVPRWSFVTGAPAVACVTAFDSYLVTLNGVAGLNLAVSRVQWCQRGDPMNWSGEGSGFEDLLDMQGQGVAIKGTADGRLLIFSDRQIWYGLTAAYPAQFQFFPLDISVGCWGPNTLADTDSGLVFLGSDFSLRLLPRGGGQSVVIAPTLTEELRFAVNPSTGVLNTGTYNARTGIYYLQIVTVGSARVTYAVNIRTGEWGRITQDFTPTAWLGVRTNAYAKNEGVFLASDTTVYSFNSTLATDSGSTVTATWRSAPLATDLPGDYKQLTEVYLDYRATSRATVTLKVSTDGGNNYETTGRTVSLASAPVAGRAKAEMYLGGAYPALEITSISTGFSLHRLDATMNVGGRA